jgi:hypothetical protein
MERLSIAISYISASKDHFEGFRYADHIFNLFESLRINDNGKLSKLGAWLTSGSVMAWG